MGSLIGNACHAYYIMSIFMKKNYIFKSLAILIIIVRLESSLTSKDLSFITYQVNGFLSSYRNSVLFSVSES